jgi:hypothetical protein
MQLIEGWLAGLNLPKVASPKGRLEGEALTYALITFLIHPGQLPDEVVELLAEDFFSRIYPNDEAH